MKDDSPEGTKVPLSPSHLTVLITGIRPWREIHKKLIDKEYGRKLFRNLLLSEENFVGLIYCYVVSQIFEPLIASGSPHGLESDLRFRGLGSEPIKTDGQGLEVRTT